MLLFSCVVVVGCVCLVWFGFAVCLVVVFNVIWLCVALNAVGYLGVACICWSVSCHVLYVCVVCHVLCLLVFVCFFIYWWVVVNVLCLLFVFVCRNNSVV